MRFGLSDLDELPSLKEFEALAREALGTDEVAADVPEEPVGELHPETDTASLGEAMSEVRQELAQAEADREHVALATAEGMPSGELDEDPPPPAAKGSSAD